MEGNELADLSDRVGARRRRPLATVPPLLRDTAFRRYWSGQTISMFGDQISSLAIPLVAVLTLRSNPTQMGILTALIWVPSLLFGLHAGAWVDRRGRRRATMIAADLGRAVLLATIPAGYAAGVLTIWQLYAVAFGTGVLSVLFNVSQSALFVALVSDRDYVTGNSLLYGSRALSFVGGPSIAGVLVEALTAPATVLADALSFVGSALFLLRIKPAEPPAAEPGDDSLTAGVRFAFGVMLLDIAAGSVFAAVIPDPLRSRVRGAFQAVNYGTRPLGALAGGFLSTAIGMRPTLWIAAIGGTAASLWLLPSPLRKFRMSADSRQAA